LKPEVKIAHEDDCYRCGEGGELVMCDKANCPKAYHLQCLKLTKPPHGKWTCPWHHCDECGKKAVILCGQCPNSFCPCHIQGNIFDIGDGKLVCSDHDEIEALMEECREDGGPRVRTPILDNVPSSGSTSPNPSDYESSTTETSESTVRSSGSIRPLSRSVLGRTESIESAMSQSDSDCSGPGNSKRKSRGKVVLPGVAEKPPADDKPTILAAESEAEKPVTEVEEPAKILSPPAKILSPPAVTEKKGRGRPKKVVDPDEKVETKPKQTKPKGRPKGKARPKGAKETIAAASTNNNQEDSMLDDDSDCGELVMDI
jgi:hypothetical protein